MRSAVSQWVLLLLLLSAHVPCSTDAFVIVSDARRLSEINGEFHSAHQLVIQCDETDGSTEQTIEVQHSNGSAITVAFTCPPPRIVYDQQLIGYIPSAVFPVFGTACLRDGRSNDTAFVPAADGVTPVSEATIGQFLSNDMQLMTHQRQLKQLAVIFTGAVFGALGGWGLCHVFGGCAPGMGALDDFMGDVQEQFANVDRLTTINSQRIGDLQGEVRATDEITRLLGNAVYENTQSIVDLNLNVDRLESMMQGLKNALFEDFDFLSTRIDAVGNFAEEEWLAIRNLTNFVTNSNDRWLEVTQGAARQVRNVAATLYLQSTNAPIQRLLTQLYHHLEDQTFPQTSEPFVRYEGIPPASGTDLNNLRSLSGAMGIANALLQRTIVPDPVGAPTSYMAQQYNITYLCDPIFALDRTTAFIHPRTFFEWLGPTNDTFNCYDSDPDAAWSCDCVFLVEYKQCAVTTSFSFPWQYDPPVNDLYPSGSPYTEHCASGIEEFTVATGGEQVLTSQTQVEDFLLDFCEGPTYVVDPSGSDRVRLFSEWSNLFPPDSRIVYNLELDNTTVEHACAPSFAVQYSGNSTEDIAQNLPYVLFQILSNNYIVWLQFMSSWWEQRVYGIIASDLTYVDNPFTRNTNEGDAHRCVDIHYAHFGTDEDKLPVYKLELLQETATFTVSVNSTSVPINGTGVSVDGSADLARVSARATTLSQAASAALPAVFYRAGRWLAHPENNLKLFDIPFGLFSGATSVNGRRNHIDYSMQLVNWTEVATGNPIDASTPITMSDFLANTNNVFDARDNGDSASSFARELQIVGTSVTCGDSYSQDGVTPLDPASDNDLCVLLSHYIVEESADGLQMTFLPREYTIEPVIDVPAGEVFKTSASYCPSGYVVVVSDGGAIATVYLNASTTNVVTFDVSVGVSPTATAAQQADPNCVFEAGEFTATATNPATFQVAVSSECGTQYINVRPVGETTNCYPNPGIVMSTSHESATQVAGLDPTVQHAIFTAQDRTQQVIEQLLAGSTEFYVGLTNLHFEGGTDLEIAERAAQLGEEQVKRVQANRTLNTPAEIAGFEQNEKAIMATSEQIGKQVIQSRKDLASTKPLYQEIANLTANITALTELFNEVQTNFTIVQARLAADQRRFEDALDGKKNCHGNIICEIFNGVRSLFGDLGDLYELFMILILLGFVGCIIACGCKIYKCSKSSANAATGERMRWYARSHEDVQLISSNGTANVLPDDHEE